MLARNWMISLIVASGLAAPLFAQQPRPAAGAAPTAVDPRVRQLLTRWEQEMARLQTMVADVSCTREDAVFKNKETLVGSAKFMRPDLARLELRHPQKPDRFERYICTGSHIYNFRPAEQRIDIIQLPAKQAGQLPDDGPLPFFFGMKADSAIRRYDFRIVKEDDHYTYVEIRPRYERDQADFVAAMLSVRKDTAMPRRVKLREPNNTEVTWDITQIQRNVQIPRREFEKPELPAKWTFGKPATLTSSPAGASKPRVVRPKQGE